MYCCLCIYKIQFTYSAYEICINAFEYISVLETFLLRCYMILMLFFVLFFIDFLFYLYTFYFLLFLFYS